MRLRSNPFQPDKPINDFDLFAGRTEELSVLVRSMYQFRSGNPRHLIVIGDRGIGKSSFINQIQSLADDSAPLLTKLGFEEIDYRFRFYVFKHIAAKHDSTETIVSSLIKQMETKAQTQSFRDRSKSFLDKWKITVQLPMLASAEYQPPSSSEIGIDFVDVVESCWSEEQHKCDGFVFIIDEIDTVAENTDIASFLKITTERLSDLRLNRVAVCLGGISGALERLKEVHPSIGRVFETIELRPMCTEECQELIHKTLMSNDDSRNVVMCDQAMKRVIEIAGGYPAVIQQICSQSFEHDVDNFINEEDVYAGIDEVITRIRRQEFDKSLNEAGTGMIRRILFVLANADELDVPLRSIAAALGRKQNEVSSPITKLVRMDKVIRIDRGVYRIKDPLLRLYIRNLDLLDQRNLFEDYEDLAK